jgi:hypothetical protein
MGDDPRTILRRICIAGGTILAGWAFSISGIADADVILFYSVPLAAITLLIGIILLIKGDTDTAILAFIPTGFFATLILFLPLSQYAQERRLLGQQKRYCEKLIPLLLAHKERYGAFPRDLDREPFNQLETPFYFVTNNVEYLSDGRQFSFLMRRTHPEIHPETYSSAKSGWTPSDDHPSDLKARGQIFIIPSRVSLVDVGGDRMRAVKFVQVLLIDRLDEPRGLCLDIVGLKYSVTPGRGLQAHTCHSYGGKIAVDQTFDAELIWTGEFRLPGFNICMTLTSAQEGRQLTLNKCDGTDQQRFDFKPEGQIVPNIQPTLCLTVDGGASIPGGDRPGDLIRKLTVERCSTSRASFQSWRVRSIAD